MSRIVWLSLFMLLQIACVAKDVKIIEPQAGLLKKVKNMEVLLDLKGQEKQWFVRDFSSRYSWVDGAALFSVSDDEKSLLIYAKNGYGEVLNTLDGRKRIMKIIQRQYNDLPMEANNQMSMMRQIVELAIFPGTIVCSEDTFHDWEVHGVMQDWLWAKESDPRVLKTFCTAPKINVDQKQNRWNFLYYVLNPAGGVNLVGVGGNVRPFLIEYLNLTTIKENGTFSYPIVGG